MVELIPKPAAALPAWQKILFYLSLLLPLVMVLAYFILDFSHERAEATLRDLEELLIREKTPEEIALEEKVFGYQRRIEDFSRLIYHHIYPSNFFEFIKKNTHPQVWFPRVDLDPVRGDVRLAAETANFITLDQQLQIFEAHPKVLNLTLTEFGIGEGGRINFGLHLELDPGLFR